MEKEKDFTDVSITNSSGQVLFEGTDQDFADAVAGLANATGAGLLFPVPEKKEFEGKQFILSNELKTVADKLIAKYENDFAHLNEANIVFLWKESGGESNGYATLGKCIRPSGLAAFFAAPTAEENVDYVIWCAADHLRENRANYRTICALLFHELKHTYRLDGKLMIVGHEFEGFAREIEEFGMWQHSIKRIAEACESVKDVQQGLFTNHD